MPVSASASGRLGVISAGQRQQAASSAPITAASSSSGAPPLATITGSTTSGMPDACSAASRPPRARISAALPSMPILIASAPISESRRSIWARTISGGTICTPRHAQRVLHRHRGDRGLGIDAEGLRGLEVGLESRRRRTNPTRQSPERAASSCEKLRPRPLRWRRRSARTTARTSFSSSPSAMTRITGSVPDLRTRMRPRAQLGVAVLDARISPSRRPAASPS